MLGRIGALTVAVAVTVSGAAFAAQIVSQGALLHGTATGTKQGQDWRGSNHLLWIVGGGIIVSGVVLVATGSESEIGNCTSPGCTPPPVKTATTGLLR
jgi:hypothetical protein